MLFLFSAEQKLGIEPGSTKASVDNYCRANKMQFSVLQLPADGSDVIKKLSHDHCWLTEKPIIVDSAATGSTATGSTAPAPAARRFLKNRGYNISRRQLLMDPEDYNNPSINPSNIPYDKLFQNAWGHKQTWHQMAEFDNSKMIWIGLLLSVLCGMMAYIDFLATFVPGNHPLASRCDVPMILAKMVTLFCCPCSKTYAWPIEEVKEEAPTETKEELEDRVKNWNLGEQIEAPAEPTDDFGGRCGNREICSKRKSWIRSDEGGGFRDNLVYLLIQVSCILSFKSFQKHQNTKTAEIFKILILLSFLPVLSTYFSANVIRHIQHSCHSTS